jgi:membrane-associated phospholipid phosphatase
LKLACLCAVVFIAVTSIIFADTTPGVEADFPVVEIQLPQASPQVERSGHAITSEHLALTAVLIASDPVTAQAAGKNLDGATFDALGRFGSMMGSRGVYAVLAALWLFDGKRGRRAAALGFTASFESAVVVRVLKISTGRARPSTDPKGAFHGPSLQHKAFPSGHAINAFAIATVLAHQYPRYRWQAYTMAGVVGLARLQEGAHFASDVYAGAVLGRRVAGTVLAQGGVFAGPAVRP